MTSKIRTYKDLDRKLMYLFLQTLYRVELVDNRNWLEECCLNCAGY